MLAFLSAVQIEMLRDELTRLQCPNDQDQIEALHRMRNALDDQDKAAFNAAWKRLKVGYGARIGVRAEQFTPESGGSAEPPDPDQLIPDAANVLRDLKARLVDITPGTNDPATRGGDSAASDSDA